MDQHRDRAEQWYKLQAYNSTPLYGYGRLEEAEALAARLNRDRDINHVVVSEVDDEAMITALNDGDGGCNLADELARMGPNR